jgi:DNA-binding transcriptional regulator YiaG
MSYNELRQAANMTTEDISKYFNIPYRTAYKWEREERQPPVYVLELMRYKLEKEKIIKVVAE